MKKRPRLPEEVGGVAADTTVNPPDRITATLSDPSPSVSIRDKLTWSLADVSALTGLSRRYLEGLLAAGRMVKPDIRCGRRCLWFPSSVSGWLDSLADRQEGRSRP
jgi:hypothetical protein